jgi:glycosyltransferase involved in cell wall biosynthesis
MRIVNIMFAKGGGGIEQASVDYCQGLRDRGHEVTAVIHPAALIRKQLQALGMPMVAVRNLGEWDPVAAWRLRRHLLALKPDIVIAHANRAYTLGKKAARGGLAPVVGVVQNYSTKRYTGADGVFTTTYDLIRHLTEQGILENRIHHIPNMVDCRELPHRHDRREPPVIGSMGRFVAKKGFDVFIAALELLNRHDIPFQAILGGAGPEEGNLRKLAAAAGLEKQLAFTGWVDDRKGFYQCMDVFCLPSLHEPFGIVLLEAFAHGVPVVSTDSEGPSEIITPNYDALMVRKGDPEILATALARLLKDPVFADGLAANAFAKTKTRYATEVVAEKIEKALETIISGWQK